MIDIKYIEHAEKFSSLPPSACEVVDSEGVVQKIFTVDYAG